MSDPARSSTSASKTTAAPSTADSLPPPQQQHSSLFVSNLTWWTNEDDLKAAFDQLSPKVKAVQFLEHKGNGKSKGIAIVEFVDAASAANARNLADGRQINGLPCAITFARSPLVKPYERRKYYYHQKGTF